MDQFWIGAGAIAGLSFIGWIIWTEWRLKTLQSATLLSQEKLKDDKIKSGVSSLSNAELDGLLKSSLGDGNPKS